MGCVLAKGVSRKREDRRRKNGDVGRDSGAATAAAAVAERRKDKKIVEAPAETSTAAPLPLEFRLKRGVSTGREEWPSWLNDVAGHAIKDWKPRRASTFEKIDKVQPYQCRIVLNFSDKVHQFEEGHTSL